MTDKTLPVMEIFGPTVQGEGIVIGQRTIFVRFGLCDYKCTMCDSMHAVDPRYVLANAKRMTQEEIFNAVLGIASKENCGWVTLSGGNPAIHELTELVHTLAKNDIHTSVETQGTFAPTWINGCTYIACSPKAPGMGAPFEQDKFKKFYDKFHYHPGFYMKIVVFSAQDLEFASMLAEMCPEIINTDRFYISCGNPFPPALDNSNASTPSTSTVSDSDNLPDLYRERNEHIARFEDLVRDMREYKSLRTARVLPQLHTWIWGNAKGR